VLRQVVPDVDCFPFAAPDYEAGGRLAVEHLVAEGARHIAFVGGLAGRAVTRKRMAGYLEAMDRAGTEPIVLSGRPGRDFGREAAFRLAKDFPHIDAALCFNDLVALGLLSGCAELGRTVGPDFKVVGFDDIEECAQSFPSVTSVRCDIAGFGRRIAETVLAQLEDGIRPPPETVSPVELIVRQSSRRRSP
jgi:LacI family transcriptional regulator